MKKQILNLVALSILLITPLVVVVAGIASELNATIPFDFTVGGRSMPAGKYYISETPNPGVIKLTSADKKAAAVIITNAVRSINAANASRLEFRRYGNQYFLGAIWTDGLETGRQIPVSKAERTAIDEARFLTGHDVKPSIFIVDCF